MVSVTLPNSAPAVRGSWGGRGLCGAPALPQDGQPARPVSPCAGRAAEAGPGGRSGRQCVQRWLAGEGRGV